MNTRNKKKEAFAKALAVINSCTTRDQIIGAFNYVDNFRKLFNEDKLADRLKQICSNSRAIMNREL